MSTLRTRLHAGSAAFETNAAHQAALVGELRERHRTVLAGGGVAMAARHHARDKILVRDRIDLLVDPLTAFLELSPLAHREITAALEHEIEVLERQSDPLPLTDANAVRQYLPEAA